jgi:ketosteroid isomerase-like protein
MEFFPICCPALVLRGGSCPGADSWSRSLPPPVLSPLKRQTRSAPGFRRRKDAVFLNPGGDLLRGSTTIAETWIRRVVNTEGFHVAGGTAEINPTGTLALVTYPVKDASGQNLPPFQVAWRHDALSGWRVVFGWSCPPCDCAVPRTPPAPPGDEVWGAESSFAQSMADRDHSAFQRHLAEDALFFGPNGPLRGRAAVAAGWSRFFQGPAAPFAWHPERSILLKSGSLALTYGPVWAPDGRRTATFSSVWRKDPDGKWRVALDKSCRACDCGGK